MTNDTKINFIYADHDKKFEDDQEKGIIDPLAPLTIFPNQTQYEIKIDGNSLGILIVAINTTGIDVTP